MLLFAVGFHKRIKKEHSFYCAEFVKYIMEKSKIVTGNKYIITPTNIAITISVNIILNIFTLLFLLILSLLQINKEEYTFNTLGLFAVGFHKRIKKEHSFYTFPLSLHLMKLIHVRIRLLYIFL